MTSQDTLSAADYIKEALEAWRNATPEARIEAVRILRAAVAAEGRKGGSRDDLEDDDAEHDEPGFIWGGGENGGPAHSGA